VTDHRCRRDERCAEAEKIEQRPTTCPECQCHLGPGYNCSISGGCGHLHKPVPTKVGGRIMAAHGLCVSCERVVAEAIGDLVGDYVALRAEQYRGGDSSLAELVTASRELPIPISLTLSTLAEQVVAETLTFVEPVTERLGIDWDAACRPKVASRFGRPPRYRDTVIFTRAARILTNSMSVLLALPLLDYRIWVDGACLEVEADGLTAALALLALHETAQAALGLTRLTHKLPAPCPRCDALALVRYDGADDVTCRVCGDRWPYEDYTRLTLVLASDLRVTG
jgi:hypothetical protein